MRKIILILLTIFIGFFIGFVSYNFFSKNTWDGKNRINLVFVGQEVFIFSLNPWERTAILLSFPSETFIEVIHGYGQYRLEAVYQLGQIENHRGGELLAGSLQENLGIPIDGFAVISNFQFPISKDKPKDYILAAFRLLLKGGETNLTKWDLARLSWQIRKIRQDKIMVIEAEEGSVLEQILLADGTKGLKIDTEKAKKLAESFFKDSKIRQEDLTIAVLNSTEHFGLAERVSRIIENIGGRVIEIGNTENSKFPAHPADGQVPNSECEIRSKKLLKKSYTVKKLMKIFSCQRGGGDLENYRAEVVLILGEDYWKKLEEKW
jgi:hypothetical protein